VSEILYHRRNRISDYDVFVQINIIRPELEKKTKQLLETTKTIRKLEQELKLEKELRQRVPPGDINKNNPIQPVDNTTIQKFNEEKQQLENEIKQLKNELHRANEEIQILRWKVEELTIK
jgi:DNA polymerase sigma